ncbi:MAG TPA: hypothetical protein VIH90_06875 [Candidatus Saccharimonadales bacterium]
MSRFLSQALAADEPHFSRGISELEKANGAPRHDIRLVSDISLKLKRSIEYLGLDPNDTTNEELYHALNEKLKTDDNKLLKELRTLAAKNVNLEANLSDGIKQLLDLMDIKQQVFSLKSSSFKKILKSTPPKKVMKSLGYRSLDSLTKHESPALIVLAINKFETKTYVRSYYQKYLKLKSTDFETKKLSVVEPKSSKWAEILKSIKLSTGYIHISCYELGSLIVLPEVNLPKKGQLTANLVQILSELSKIASTSNYLKLNQVTADFGLKVYDVAEHEPFVSLSILSKPIPWHLAQSVIATRIEDIDLPQFSGDELGFSKLLDKLGDVVSDLKFWQSTEYLALVSKGDTISLNILDVADNLSNELSYQTRRLTNFRNSLWQELMGRYINPDLTVDSLVPAIEMAIDV